MDLSSLSSAVGVSPLMSFKKGAQGSATASTSLLLLPVAAAATAFAPSTGFGAAAAAAATATAPCLSRTRNCEAVTLSGAFGFVVSTRDLDPPAADFLDFGSEPLLPPPSAESDAAALLLPPSKKDAAWPMRSKTGCEERPGTVGRKKGAASGLVGGARG